MPLDVDYFNQDTVRELGSRFGPGGPLALLAIIAEANRHAVSGIPVNKQGQIGMRYSALAGTAWLKDADTAREVVSACVELDLLELLDGSDRKRFEARLLKWDRWQTRDAGAAVRQAKSRARKTEPEVEPDEPYPF